MMQFPRKYYIPLLLASTGACFLVNHFILLNLPGWWQLYYRGWNPVVLFGVFVLAYAINLKLLGGRIDIYNDPLLGVPLALVGFIGFIYAISWGLVIFVPVILLLTVLILPIAFGVFLWRKWKRSPRKADAQAVLVCESPTPEERNSADKCGLAMQDKSKKPEPPKPDGAKQSGSETPQQHLERMRRWREEEKLARKAGKLLPPEQWPETTYISRSLIRASAQQAEQNQRRGGENADGQTVRFQDKHCF